MQVGDLVELSAAGSKAKQNDVCHNQYGIIMKVDLNRNHPISINWFRKDGSIHQMPMARREIKFMRGEE